MFIPKFTTTICGLLIYGFTCLPFLQGAYEEFIILKEENQQELLNKGQGLLEPKLSDENFVKINYCHYEDNYKDDFCHIKDETNIDKADPLLDYSSLNQKNNKQSVMQNITLLMQKSQQLTLNESARNAKKDIKQCNQTISALKTKMKESHQKHTDKLKEFDKLLTEQQNRWNLLKSKIKNKSNNDQLTKLISLQADVNQHDKALETSSQSSLGKEKVVE